eukprot:m.101400 g.101400  ORF g.101400 m.101400 type:complete len:1294 (-) comp10387_c0_seq3:1588-5469(-)
MFRFSIDRGGTFTDVHAQLPGGGTRVMKLLSVDPANYSDAPREGIRRILESELGRPFPIDSPIDCEQIEWIRMGTTVATNALLERKGERMALVVTRGFRDVLAIGTQARPRIFDLQINVPDTLYDDVVEVTERLILDDTGDVVGHTGERLTVETPVDLPTLRTDLQAVYDRGIRSLAVVLMHSYLHPAHEEAVDKVAREIGFTHVSLSSNVMRMAKLVPRGYTCCADAYLTPIIKSYVEGFAGGFKNNLEGVRVLFMQSDGGLAPVAEFNGARAILSGPAAGVVGYAATAYSAQDGRAVIGFDMGGTSTDVSRYAGSYEHVFESTTAGVTIQAPQLDINTVAAGGGSCLMYRSGMFAVGPESAGSHPGPVCYRKGGPLAVTDANLFLGRIQPKHFPAIFGATQDQPLDLDATRAAFQLLTDEINASEGNKGKMSTEDVALGFVRVANEAMCRPIRELTQAKGFDTTAHVLSCFGGAGGQHACAIARSLGMTEIHVHKYSGILSAFGLAMANVVSEQTAPCAALFGPDSYSRLTDELVKLTAQGAQELGKNGFATSTMTVELFLNMRYRGTDHGVMTPPVEGAATALDAVASTSMPSFLDTFGQIYRREFGFDLPEADVLVDDVRVRVTAHTDSAKEPPQPRVADPTAPPVQDVVKVCFDGHGWVDCPEYQWEALGHGHVVPGPGIVLSGNSTVVVDPGCTAHVTELGDIRIVVGDGVASKISTTLNSIHLAIFGHRFMSIAEQMGRSLQRTSISVNIKERLDFSCALFSPDGGLVANAPHIPVHLGAMQEAVRFQIQHLGNDIHPGDVLLSNHPAAGGSHLPDLTVMTPVFVDGQSRPVFFVASRGHHADIGGITPGSMPPTSTTLAQEGAAIVSFKLVKGGVFQEEGITAVLRDPGPDPESSGTRKLSDNLSDLRAQVAANQRGIQLVNELIVECGLDVVLAYMDHIQTNAEGAVRDMLKATANHAGARADVVMVGSRVALKAVDYMDDGSPIALTVTIDPQSGDTLFDFTGTGYEVLGNCNAPKAVTYSAVIYCLRCMVGYDIPLNQGCLAPITIHIPEGSILNPSRSAAVVGGNVLTSQRVTDVVLKAFGACAASQGCMNNTTYGDDTFGYYETVAGGAGAGPTWHGKSGVHTHMTNTRITDPEVLERRYPVILEQFTLRNGSGGHGKFHGGDGVVRRTRFRKDLKLSILSERRAFSPFGMAGGACGERGTNVLVRSNGQRIRLGGKCTVPVHKGDVFYLETPGGGGYGLGSDDAASALTEGSKAGQGVAVPVPLAGGSLGKWQETQLGV